MKRALRILVVGLLAGAMVPLGSPASAKYPPDQPFRTCLQRLNEAFERKAAFFRGEGFNIQGRPGCALQDDGSGPAAARVFVVFRTTDGDRIVLSRNRIGSPNGFYNTHFRVPQRARTGLVHTVIVRITGDQAKARINVKPGGENASAALPATKTTLPAALALAVLALGFLFVFTPVGRRGLRLMRRGP